MRGLCWKCLTSNIQIIIYKGEPLCESCYSVKKDLEQAKAITKFKKVVN